MDAVLNRDHLIRDEKLSEKFWRKGVLNERDTDACFKIRPTKFISVAQHNVSKSIDSVSLDIPIIPN